MLTAIATTTARAQDAVTVEPPPAEQPPSVAPSSETEAPVDVPAAVPSTPVVTGPPPNPPNKFFSIPQANTASSAAATEGFQLNFIDTDIASVVSAVLGDGLGMPYVVDPQVKGTMTLQATRPLTREESLAALETALRIQGAAMVDVSGVLNVVLAKDAPKRITTLRVPNQDAPGFGIYVVPLQYVGVQEMEKILQPFAPDGGILRSDAARNLLLLAGTRQEISTLMNVISTFDVDWLTGMSFTMYQLENVEAKALATELGEVFSDGKSPIAGVVKIVALSRLNSIMVVTPQEKYLSEVESWIKKLDVTTATPGRRIYVYDVQNGKADELAKSLSSILSIEIDQDLPPVATEATPSTSLGASNSQRGFGTGTGSTTASTSSVVTTTSSSSVSRRSANEEASGIKIVPNSENNSLLIMATTSEYAVIDAALKRLDVVPIQVLIEASIAEVTLTDDLRFGLQWSYQSNRGPIIYSEASGGTINQQFPGLSFLYTGRADIRAVLNSLESLTNVRVISSPKLMVLNNREAQLQIGDQVPIATQSAVSTSASSAPIVNSVQLRDTGVILRVTPRANKSGRIFLEVAQEVSNVVPTSTSSIDSPTIQQRKISSTVSVENGETIALGGMIKESQTKSRTGIPILRKIPIVGNLFGSTSNGKVRTELIVLLSPHIVRSAIESDAVTQELQKQFGELKRVVPNWGKALKSTKRDEVRGSGGAESVH